MVDDELSVRVVACHFSEDGEFTGAHDVNGDVCFGAGGKDLVDADVVGFDFDACEHDACAYDARGGCPLFHLLFDVVGIGVERSDESKFVRMFGVNLEGVGCVVLVHREG